MSRKTYTGCYLKPNPYALYTFIGKGSAVYSMQLISEELDDKGYYLFYNNNCITRITPARFSYLHRFKLLKVTRQPDRIMMSDLAELLHPKKQTAVSEQMTFDDLPPAHFAAERKDNGYLDALVITNVEDIIF